MSKGVYHFSRPLALQELEIFLLQDRRLPALDGEAASQMNTLLLVDDEPHILTALKRLLHQDGYRILAATSAAEGFELLALNDVQAILCDQRILVVNGNMFLDRVKELYPDAIIRRTELNDYWYGLQYRQVLDGGNHESSSTYYHPV